MISNSKAFPSIPLMLLLSITLFIWISSCSPSQQSVSKSLEQSAELIKEGKTHDALTSLKHSLKQAEILPQKSRFDFNDTYRIFDTLLDSISSSQITMSDKIETYTIVYQIAEVVRFGFDPKLNLGIMASVDDFSKNQKILKMINRYLGNCIHSLIEADSLISALDLLIIYRQRSSDGTPIPGGDLGKLKLIEGVILSTNMRSNEKSERNENSILLREVGLLYEDVVSNLFHAVESNVKSRMLQIVDAYIRSELPRDIKHAFYSYNVSFANQLADKRFLIDLLEIYMIPRLDLMSFRDLIEESTHSYSENNSLRGKVLPIDIFGKYAHINDHVYYSLPENMQPKFPEEVMTFVFIETSTIKVGEYVHKETKQFTGDAEVERWIVTIVDRNTRSILHKRVFTGNASHLPSPWYDVPDPINPVYEVIEYLNCLLMNDSGDTTFISKK